MIKELIKNLDANGIKLWVDENEKLHYKAPEGAMNKERIAVLKENKAEIIKLLVEENKFKKIIHDSEHEFDEFPITDIQGAYLVGRNEAYDLGGVGCHGYVELTMPVMDKDRLEKAYHRVISRHEMLRGIVLKNGVQKVLENVEFPALGYQDLRGLSKEQCDKKLLSIRHELESKKYDPEKWPLYDFVLTTMDDKSILHCSIDMLIADFVSVDLILKEIDFYYYNEDKELETLDVSYRDIIINEKLKEKTLKGAMEKEHHWKYWNNKIQDLPGKPELPVLSDMSGLSKEFEKHRFELEKEKWQEICKKAQSKNLTPSSIILSVFTDVIRLFSKNRRFCINLTQLKRPSIHPKINNIVGDFTSVEVLDVNTTGNFIERTSQLQQELWNDLEHGSISGIEILREAGKVQNTNMIVPVVYTSTLGLYSDNGGNGEFMRDAKITYRISQTPQVWIDCQVSEYKEGLEINWDVRKGVFPEGIIDDAFEVFENGVKALAAEDFVWETNTVCKITDTMMKARREANETTLAIDNSGCMQDGFWKHVKETPEKIAIIHEGKEYSYKTVSSYVNSVMNKLTELGCKEGDMVAVLQNKGVWQIASVLAVLSINATYVPIACDQPIERIKLILEDAGINYVIGEDTQNVELKQNIIDVHALELDEKIEFSIPKNHSKYPAYLIYTSGSTGVPKGVVIGHAAALNTIKDINRRFKVTSDDKIIALANLAFDLSVYDIFGMLDAGGTLILPNKGKEKDPKHWVELIEKYEVTLWNTVPAMMQLLVTYLGSRKGKVISNMRNVLLSGDWIPVTLPKEIKKYLPNASTISLGGATEAGIWSIFYEIKDVNINYNSIPYGKPLSNQKFYILNNDLNDVPNLVTGEIYIAGDSLANEYYKSEELNKKKFIVYPVTGERIYDTGDIGRYLADGNIEFQGRSDNQIKIRGHRIELSEIESVLNNYEKIQTAIALKTSNDKIVTFVEAKNAEEKSEQFDEVVGACYSAGDEVLKDVDRDLFKKWVELSDKTTLYEIMTVFYKKGIFIDNISLFAEEELREKLKVLPKYNRLLKRWLNTLESKGFIEFIASENKYRRKIKEFDVQDTKNYRDEFEKTENALQYGKELYNYMKESSNHIEELLQGSVDPLALFFPQGKTDVAMAAYNDNMINRSLNSVVKSAIKGLIDKYSKINGNRKVRILEIGAGVGGTTVDLIPELKGYNIEYRFTDVSTFFINEAKKKFADYPFMSYGVFDINKNYSEQGLLASSWDIILSANVLHNSKNAPSVLSSLKQILAPEGALIVIDATIESLSLLTSLEFKEGLTGFTDSRKGSDRTFFSRDEWYSMFEEMQADVLCTYPRIEDPIALAGQSVFITKIKSNKTRVDYSEIDEYLKEKLPSYMVPDRIEVLPAFPVTNNGKIDRKKLLTRVVENEDNTVLEEKFANELEEKIAEIWKSVLNVDHVGRNENFYAAGGDSLLIAQVVTKIQEGILEAADVKWDILMRLMLKNMTISEFSSALENEASLRADAIKKEKENNSQSLVVFKDSEEKNCAKVLFHAATGTLTPYNKILGQLLSKCKDDEGLLGMCFGNEELYISQDTSTLIVDTAHRYAKLLVDKGYKSYELIGYCMGGWIAIETARKLMEYGVEVKNVTTISSSLGSPIVDNDLLLEAAFANIAGAKIDEQIGGLIQEAIQKIAKTNGNKVITNEDLCNLDGKYKELAEHFKELSKLTAKERLDNIFKTINNPQEDIIKDNNKMLHIIYKLFYCNYRGILAYKPEPYLGDVNALMVRDKSRHFFQADIGYSEEDVWKEIVLGDLHLEYIGGNHQTCLEGENMNDVLRIIYGEER